VVHRSDYRARMSGAPPRLQPLTAADDPRLEELFSKGLTGPDGTPLNIFGTLAHHPDLLRRWLVFAAHVLSKNTLPERERELLILRTGWNCQSRYEFSQHVVIGKRCGITDAEIDMVRQGVDAGWTDEDRLLICAADQLHDRSTIDTDVWDKLRLRFSEEQMLDLVATVGNYHLVAMFLNSTGVRLDPGVPDAFA
jgi:alkylhydroperoxidase family enzyme